MKATKLGLLVLILAFGSTVETAWQVRNHFGPGFLFNWGWNDRFRGPSFTFTAEQTATVPAATAVEIENAFGSVNVAAGSAGEVKVSLRKVVFQGTEEKARAYADRIQVQARREGGALRLSTNRPDLERAASGEEPVGFQTDFDVTVPPGTAVRVANEHGAVDVVDVARAEISASHDSVHVERVAGPAEIETRHGDVRVSAIKGDLKLTSRHGGVTVEDVDGLARLDVQHGDMRVARVGSLVLAGAFGDVAVETVRGDAEVRNEHGEVRATDVGGRASIATTFQGATLAKVKGDASVRTEHGDVSVSDVAGAVEAQASFDDVALARIGGPVTVEVSHGGVHARDLAKGAKVRGSGDDIVLDGFRGPVEVTAERASVRLVPAGAIEAAVTVNATHGGIELQIPDGSRLQLQASASPGEITADVAGLDATSTSPGKLTAVLGGGGHPVVLTTAHGDVRLHGAAAVALKTP